MIKKHILLFYSFLFLSTSLQAQGLYEDTRWKENHVLEVKVLDEFIDRFNKDTSSAFVQNLKDIYRGKLPLRTSMIKSLFDRKQTWDTSLVKNFALTVTKRGAPHFLGFSDKDWFAHVRCKVTYQGKSRQLDLILKVEEGIHKSTKWVMVSAMADFLNFKYPTSKSKIPLPRLCGSDLRDPDNQMTVFLDPMSHSTNFINLHQAFEDPPHFKDYLYEGPLTEQMQLLLKLVTEKAIHFDYVQHISYHFLQIPNYIMVVEYFNRNSKNSGWLISNLLKVSYRSKPVYKKQFLNVLQDE
ncbi:MAG TPA: hypothetical protein PLU53_04745 [Bacteroidia bacterium]|nr:hypothetical protein [Bacteroidia bacterium]